MSNSKFIQKWFESTKRPIGFSFSSFKEMLNGLDYIDTLYRKGIFKGDSILAIKTNYLNRFR